MRVEASESAYHEADDTRKEFNRSERNRCLLLLRRLRFLEKKVRDEGPTTGGSNWAEWEIEALEWILDEVGFLAERTPTEGNAR